MTKLKNILVATASIVVFANIANAQEVKANYTVNSAASVEEPLKVKYLGTDGDYLHFQVTIESKTPASSFFVINDLNEGELYSSNFAGTLKVQTVKIEKTNNDQVLSFKMVSGKKTYSKSFSVNTALVETTTVAERDVTKL